MKVINLSWEELLHKEQAHQALAQALALPDYYGKNLDALYDCLTELGDCTLVLRGAEVLRASGGYGAKVLQVLEDAAQANPCLRLEARGADVPRNSEEESRRDLWD